MGRRLEGVGMIRLWSEVSFEVGQVGYGTGVAVRRQRERAGVEWVCFFCLFLLCVLSCCFPGYPVGVGPLRGRSQKCVAAFSTTLTILSDRYITPLDCFRQVDANERVLS